MRDEPAWKSSIHQVIRKVLLVGRRRILRRLARQQDTLMQLKAAKGLADRLGKQAVDVCLPLEPVKGPGDRTIVVLVHS